MGARLYFEVTAYDDDPAAALRSLQEKQLASYDLSELLAAHMEARQKAVDATAEDDEYGLNEYYKQELARAKSLSRGPIPTQFQDRLDFVRQLHADGDGVGNILDVEGLVSRKNPSGSGARPLSLIEVIDKFGTNKLLIADTQQHVSSANGWLGRGECICFPLYATLDDNRPTEWCFVGNTID